MRNIIKQGTKSQNTSILTKTLFHTLTLWLLLVNPASASVGGWLFETNREIEAFIAGLKEKTIEVNGETWLYYLGKDETATEKLPTCTLLLHGFSAEASHWFRFARSLEDTSCVLIPDLPGFGRSTYALEQDYSIPAQVLRLHRFLAELDLADSYHLAGNSMGGQILGMYAVEYPNEVTSLTLMNAGGVQSPQKSQLDIKVAASGKSVFEVENAEEYKSMLGLTMSDPPWVPSVVTNYLAEEAINRTQRHRAIFAKLYQQDMLDEKLKQITARTLILWGDEDQLLHPSMAQVFHQGIKDSTVIVMPGLGHLPFLEQPGKTAHLFNQFISNQLK